MNDNYLNNLWKWNGSLILFFKHSQKKNIKITLVNLPWHKIESVVVQVA